MLSPAVCVRVSKLTARDVMTPNAKSKLSGEVLHAVSAHHS